MSKLKLFFCSILFLLSANSGHSQAFDGGILLGLNASQIDGDLLAGYNKLGLTGGVYVAFPISEKLKLGMELLYSQRGSRNEIRIGVASPQSSIHLQYIEIPVMIEMEDWYIEEDDYNKVKFGLGFSYGNLFRVTTVNSGFNDNDLENFLPHDLSILGTATYFVGPRLAFSVRGTRSLTRMYSFTDLTGNPSALIGYFLTFRAEYHF